MKAVGIAEIPIPESARQIEMALEQHDDIPEAESDGDEKDAS